MKLSTKFEIQLYLEHFTIRFRVDLTLDQLDSLLHIVFTWYFAEMYKLVFVDVEARIMHLASFLVFATYLFLLFTIFFRRIVLYQYIHVVHEVDDARA